MTKSSDVIRLQVFIPGRSWVNVLGDSTTLTFERGNEQTDSVDKPTVGTLAAAFLGATGDPSLPDPVVRPTRAAEVQAMDAGGSWNTIWSGKLGIPSASYDDAGRVVSAVAATDAVNLVSNNKPAVTMYRTGSFRQQIFDAVSRRPGGQIIDPNVGSSSDDITRTNLVDAGDQTMLARIGVVLDSWPLCALWASRWNTYGFRGFGQTTVIPTDAVHTFSDKAVDVAAGALSYTAIDLTHDLETFRNSLAVTEPVGDLNRTWSEQSLTSEWGRSEGAATIVPGTATGGYTVAQRVRDIFATKPAPAFRVKSISVDMHKARQLVTSVPTDLLYQTPIRIKHTPSGHDAVYRIIRESHAVTPDSWRATYTLKPVVAARTVTASVES
ncbi:MULTISPECIES: hypothetical protein [unclassified Aeromicrobium]|uniref:hypothetical protein n=1 Tax=unclassified Aeromicrobium TaxID=2633570 RepID=UPI00288AD2E6|nr:MULTISPECIES: hypothetical protein [unclassified Aeromicrobium]